MVRRSVSRSVRHSLNRQEVTIPRILHIKYSFRFSKNEMNSSRRQAMIRNKKSTMQSQTGADTGF